MKKHTKLKGYSFEPGLIFSLNLPLKIYIIITFLRCVSRTQESISIKKVVTNIMLIKLNALLRTGNLFSTQFMNLHFSIIFRLRTTSSRY